jgi:hypothetical protein
LSNIPLLCEKSILTELATESRLSRRLKKTGGR